MSFYYTVFDSQGLWLKSLHVPSLEDALLNTEEGDILVESTYTEAYYYNTATETPELRPTMPMPTITDQAVAFADPVPPGLTAQFWDFTHGGYEMTNGPTTVPDGKLWIVTSGRYVVEFVADFPYLSTLYEYNFVGNQPSGGVSPTDWLIIDIKPAERAAWLELRKTEGLARVRTRMDQLWEAREKEVPWEGSVVTGVAIQAHAYLLDPERDSHPQRYTTLALWAAKNAESMEQAANSVIAHENVSTDNLFKVYALSVTANQDIRDATQQEHVDTIVDNFYAATEWILS